MTDTDWLALADFLDAHANDMRSWTEDEPKFRAAADGLRQYAAITTADKNWRTLKALYDEHLRVVRAERDEARDQYAAITAAIGDPEQLRKAAQALSIHYRRHAAGDYLRRIAAAAASLSPTPTPQHCPTCRSRSPMYAQYDPADPSTKWDGCPDSWHQAAT
jgi:hypothetical protein